MKRERVPVSLTWLIGNIWFNVVHNTKWKANYLKRKEDKEAKRNLIIYRREQEKERLENKQFMENNKRY